MIICISAVYRLWLITSLKAIVYDLFNRLLGSGPVYAALGNHDSYNQSVCSLYVAFIYL
jgi:hypothetical protein